MKRETGYYCVKYSGKWCVAYFEHELWSMPKWLIDFIDEDFEQIDETRIKNPDEK